MLPLSLSANVSVPVPGDLSCVSKATRLARAELAQGRLHRSADRGDDIESARQNACRYAREAAPHVSVILERCKLQPPLMLIAYSSRWGWGAEAVRGAAAPGSAPSITKTKKCQSTSRLRMPTGLTCKPRQCGRCSAGRSHARSRRGIDPSLQPPCSWRAQPVTRTVTLLPRRDQKKATDRRSKLRSDHQPIWILGRLELAAGL